MRARSFFIVVLLPFAWSAAADESAPPLVAVTEDPVTPRDTEATPLDELRSAYNRFRAAIDQRSFDEAFDSLELICRLDVVYERESQSADDPLSLDHLLREIAPLAETESQKRRLDAAKTRRRPATADGTRQDPIPRASSETEHERSVRFMGKVGARVNGEKSDVGGSERKAHRIQFKGGEVAAVWIRGSGKTNLDLFIYDDAGKQVVATEDEKDDCAVKWWPAWTAEFRVEVVNRGSEANTYYLYTN